MDANSSSPCAIMSDSTTSFATGPLDDLLAAME
jgi:hypothetical protein